MEGRGNGATLGRNDLVGEGVAAALMVGLAIGTDGGGAVGDIAPTAIGCARADVGNDRTINTAVAAKGNAEYNLVQL